MLADLTKWASLHTAPWSLTRGMSLLQMISAQCNAPLDFEARDSQGGPTDRELKILSKQVQVPLQKLSDCTMPIRDGMQTTRRIDKLTQNANGVTRLLLLGEEHILAFVRHLVCPNDRSPSRLLKRASSHLPRISVPTWKPDELPALQALEAPCRPRCIERDMKTSLRSNTSVAS